METQDNQDKLGMLVYQDPLVLVVLKGLLGSLGHLEQVGHLEIMEHLEHLVLMDSQDQPVPEVRQVPRDQMVSQDQ